MLGCGAALMKLGVPMSIPRCPPLDIKVLKPRHLRRNGTLWREAEQNTARTAFSPVRGRGEQSTSPLQGCKAGIHFRQHHRPVSMRESSEQDMAQVQRVEGNIRAHSLI